MDDYLFPFLNGKVAKSVDLMFTSSAVCAQDKQMRDPLINNCIAPLSITRGSCWALGHVQSCSVSYSMSHSAHFVTSLNISGKQDVQKAHSDEQAILGMKMKKDLENMLLIPQCEVSHHLLTIFSGSFSTSDESQGKWTTEQEEGAGVGYGSQKTHLRLDVTQGLLNLLQPQESTLRK